MSRLFKKVAKKTSEIEFASTGLVNASDLQQGRRAYRTSHLPNTLPGARVVTGAGVFSQVMDLDAQYGTVEDYNPFEEGEFEQPDMNVEGDIIEPGLMEVEARQKAKKKENQWKAWSTQVIPKLLEPYVSLLQQTQSLRDMSEVRNQDACKGCHHGKLKDVVLIFFDSMSLSKIVT